MVCHGGQVIGNDQARCEMSGCPSFEEVRVKALSLGWDDCAITSAEIPVEDRVAWRSWLAEGRHGSLIIL